MTTNVVIACPYNSLFNAYIYVEKHDGEKWTRGAEPIIVPPGKTAETQTIDGTTRLVIEQSNAVHAEQLPSPTPEPKA